MSVHLQTNFESLEGLQEVAQSVRAFSQERFLHQIHLKNYSIEEIVRIDSLVLDALSKMQDEYITLEQFSKVFNRQFVTLHNNCFNSAHVLLWKIHSNTSHVKKIYQRLTPNSHADLRNLPPNTNPPSLYSRSSLGLAEYTPPIFDIKTYPQEVQTLFSDLQRFFAISGKSLSLCINVMRNELYIRRNALECKKLYHLFKDDNYHRIKSYMKSINLQVEEFSEYNSPAIELRNHSKSEEEFSQKGFHNLEYSDACKLATKEIVEESQRGEFSKEELTLFGNHNLIHQVRYIISNFDTYLDLSYSSHKKLPAQYVACLLRWAKPKEDRAFVDYFKNVYLENGGKHKVPSNSAVNIKKNKLDDNDSLWRKLNMQWNNIKF